MQKELNDNMTKIISKNKGISFKEAFIKACLAAKIIPDTRNLEICKYLFTGITNKPITN